MRRFIVGSFGVGLSITACFSGSGPSNNSGPDGSTGPVTYYKDIVPIVQQHCQACHQPGGIAPFSLIDYNDASANAAAMVSDTQAGIMPPWGAQTPTSECTVRYPWVGDLRLSAAEIATIQSWNQQGAQAGNPSDAPAAINIPLSNDLPGATNLAPTTPFTLTQTTDYFRCYVLDPQITASNTFITGTNVQPGNKTIVHHALIYSVPAGSTIPPPTDGVPNQYDCFGGPGVSNPQLVGLWAPGAAPYMYPANVGHPVDVGTLFIMQVHYHPHANATMDPDTTTFQFTTTTTMPTWSVGTILLGNYDTAVTNGTGLENPPFLIPPNTPSQVFTMDTQIPAKLPTAKILSVAAHMHLVGTDEKVTITRANPDAENPASECLLQVPSWNFNWQRAYEYNTDITTLPTVGPGDVLTTRCTYNNTMENPILAASLTEEGMSQTQPVSLGETTNDEMCLGAFWYVYPSL
jgi:Copper type II ascorbate-dependent monooxygenase, N-terminal domain/Copper type II ascorbate-dependent monooxygenase, C-terminal domain